jgi:hypothetical protein
MLTAAGIDPATLANPDAYVPTGAVQSFIRQAVSDTGGNNALGVAQ